MERDDSPLTLTYQVGKLECWKNLHDTSGVTKFWMIYQTFLFGDLFYNVRYAIRLISLNSWT